MLFKQKKEIIAMLLAGGQGSRLGVLTKNIAKPAVPYGGKYRIIDFTLSNCINSNIDTVGVLTQYQPLELNAYIGNGQPWDLDRLFGGVRVLPPYVRGKGGEWYKGTANAIYQNINYVDMYNPEYVLILSGDHIYKMNYSKMLAAHKKNQASCTIAVIEVPMKEASRFGVMNTNEDGSIYDFEEKPKEPKSNLASMGVYIFTWKKLKEYLKFDEENKQSNNDFGKNIIPAMLARKEKMMAYKFEGYWKDVGTVESLWEANMDILKPEAKLNLDDTTWKIYARTSGQPSHYMSDTAEVRNSTVSEGCTIEGRIHNSIIFPGCVVAKDALVSNSIIMPGAVVEEGAEVHYAIIGENAVIGKNARVGEKMKEGGHSNEKLKITLIGQDLFISQGTVIPKGMMVEENR